MIEYQSLTATMINFRTHGHGACALYSDTVKLKRTMTSNDQQG
jgi:hypothetical protein